MNQSSQYRLHLIGDLQRGYAFLFVDALSRAKSVPDWVSADHRPTSHAMLRDLISLRVSAASRADRSLGLSLEPLGLPASAKQSVVLSQSCHIDLRSV